MVLPSPPVPTCLKPFTNHTVPLVCRSDNTQTRALVHDRFLRPSFRHGLGKASPGGIERIDNGERRYTCYDCFRKSHVHTGRFITCAVPCRAVLLTDTGAVIVSLRVNKHHPVFVMANLTGRLISSPASRAAAGCRPRAVRASLHLQ